ncbi:polyprenol phosphomannose-dependent alpha 1,6 mannosyltransferase MptB [Planotetraspora sp. A-T 1434]|uniref:polyprenol phosphomannose-dependent alpha 1,6 mannosyltransferase MptB n=1 Tax=Planotetraspora sp. A-T 1434 TaxID=2979219 RepID=UPI0021C0A6E4|nr:polyprenol phosphomannose-dependent alpha 1,6 mannosyltransferase MptB [Planotetraspora sp. A-T 1434]MCT9931739.1 polyprenol phosphomannose-dependent alpha 1,6 mannosyltransferase MptB [Planotetraspora sp. A-T 1434]
MWWNSGVEWAGTETVRGPGLLARLTVAGRSTVSGSPPSPILAIAASGLSILITITIGLLGPSAMVPALRGPAWQPPYSLGLRPDGHLVIGLAAAAVILGTLGLVAGLRSLRRLPDARWLVLAGCLAAAVLAFLPPSGSSDHLNYAAYGRLAALGHDPYVTVPADLPDDPVVGAVQEWRKVPSVYGPVATAVQTLAGEIGGDSLRLTVFVMALANAAAFVATALLLHRFTRHDPVRQRRAALLWTLNPLVVYQLAAGMHLDTLAIAFVVAALVVRPGRPGSGVLAGWGSAWGSAWGSGVLLGLGIAVKVTVGLVALGPAWELRGAPRKLALVAGSATLTVLVAYWLAGPHALNQVLNASKSVSLATPWKLVKEAAQLLAGPGSYHAWIQVGSLLLLATLAFLLLRALRAGTLGAPTTLDSAPTAPTARTAPTAAAVDAQPALDDPTALDAPRVALAFAVAWLFATPYALPWYDGLAFALLALVPWPALDGFMVARLAALSLAYLPARQYDQPSGMEWLVSVVRSQVVPWFLLALTIGLAWWAARAGARARRRPA